jgi:hypothetical protein
MEEYIARDPTGDLQIPRDERDRPDEELSVLEPPRTSTPFSAGLRRFVAGGRDRLPGGQ